MKKNIVKFKWLIIPFLFFIYLPYIFWNTGIHSDDYTEILHTQNINNFIDYLEYTWNDIYNFIDRFIFFWVYPVFGQGNLWLYDIIKTIYHFLGILMMYKFASYYLPKDRALLFSFLFIFYPTHDSTFFWYMVCPYSFVPCLIMYCHYLLRLNKVFLSYCLLILIGLSSYITPVYIIGLSIIFVLEKSYKKFIIFISPAILYIIFYVTIAFVINTNENRIDENINLIEFIKNFIFQTLSGIDAFIGPSFFLKIFWSISNINLNSILLFLIFSLLIYFNLKSKRPKFSSTLFISFLFVLILSFGMFALTGLYTQTSFNLGNRVTVYGSLVFAYLISILTFSKKFYILLIFLFVLPIFGLSNYWKNLNDKQIKIINNINANQSFNYINTEDTLLIVGNIYHKLGPFSHIEFFSMPWLVKTIYGDKVKTNKIMAITSYTYLDEGIIIDQKFDEKLTLNKSIYLYESDKNFLSKISKSDVPMILESTPKEIRHWLQLFDYQPIRSLIIFLNPRLEYLFN